MCKDVNLDNLGRRKEDLTDAHRKAMATGIM